MVPVSSLSPSVRAHLPRDNWLFSSNGTRADGYPSQNTATMPRRVGIAAGQPDCWPGCRAWRQAWSSASFGIS